MCVCVHVDSCWRFPASIVHEQTAWLPLWAWDWESERRSVEEQDKHVNVDFLDKLTLGKNISHVYKTYLCTGICFSAPASVFLFCLLFSYLYL